MTHLFLFYYKFFNRYLETVTVYVEKPSQVVKFVNTTTNAEVGTSATFDFGSGSVNAVALTTTELTNLV